MDPEGIQQCNRGKNQQQYSIFVTAVYITGVFKTVTINNIKRTAVNRSNKTDDSRCFRSMVPNFGTVI